jgi:cytochrome P450
MEQTAVIKETLRLATPTPAGLPRVVPPPGAVISGVRIPGGVRLFTHPFSRFIPDGLQQSVVSQSVVFVSYSEEIFSQPYEFVPDRWLLPDSKALDPWLVSFSKGPRSCIGIK